MRHALKIGEYYAIKPSAIERDADGFFVVVGNETPANEPRGSVVLVHVRGALCQFKGEGGDSYEAIIERVGEAFAVDPKPSSVVLCISSPGGIVAGLNECVFRLQRMSEEAKIPLVAFVNELAASAAFALACSCLKRLAPPSAIVGSIGCISTMVSQAARDKAEGLDFRIITSGKRKADGHPHQAISDDAVKAERARNAELAEQFYGLAAKALKTSPRRLEGLEAAIYVGEAAKKVGLIDAVISLDKALAGLDRSDTKPPSPAPNQGNVTDRRAKEVDGVPPTGTALSLKAQSVATAQSGPTHQEARMKPKVQALITKTQAAIATETDPAQLRILEAKLGTFLARAEMDDDGDDDDKPKKKGDDDDDGDDESKSAKHAARAEKLKAKAKATDLRSKASQKKSEAAELEEEAKKCEEESASGEESSEEEARLHAALAAAPNAGAQEILEALTGLKGSAAVGAAVAKLTRLDKISADVEAIKLVSDAKEKADLVRRAGRYVPPHLVANLDLVAIRALVKEAEAKGSPMVATENGDLIVPKVIQPGTLPALPPEQQAMVEAAVAAVAPADKDAFRKTLVNKLSTEHTERMTQALNGAGRV